MRLTISEILDLFRVRKSETDGLPYRVNDYLKAIKALKKHGKANDDIANLFGISVTIVKKSLNMNESDIRDAQDIAEQLLQIIGYDPVSLLPRMNHSNRNNDLLKYDIVINNQIL